ncbi:hypothetical protein BurJ1DRAFT_4559 [Burkholderiales bacterium JOSHI_001]|nr:hypothetical protein BurJ1DRAFT_4559 [Burkholderiales bacterium JOSHI_001]
MHTDRTGRRGVRLGFAAALSWLLVFSPGGAQAQAGFYSGAYAQVGDHGCDGADSQGFNPFGGCTPGTFGLIHATALAHGLNGPANFDTATADLAQGRLSVVSQFPLGAGNTAFAGANFLDTITVVGHLPEPAHIVVSLTIDSTVTGPPDSNTIDPITAQLLDAGGLQTYYRRQVPSGNCGPTLSDGALCDQGYGHFVRTLTHTETVDATNRSFQVAATLTGGGNFLLVDGSATLSFALPAGLSFTSASGVFPAVPEPATWASLLCGLALLRLLSSSSNRCGPRRQA